MAGELIFLDVASKCGVAEGLVGAAVPTIYCERFARPDERIEAGLRRAGNWMAARIQLSRPRAVYIEAPLSSGVWGKTNSNTTLLLQSLWAALATVCGIANVPCRRGNVQTIRKFFVGEGRPDDPKDRVMEVCQRLGWKPKNYDEADAAAGWYWACSLYEGGPRNPSQHWAWGEGALL